MSRFALSIGAAALLIAGCVVEPPMSGLPEDYILYQKHPRQGDSSGSGFPTFC